MPKKDLSPTSARFDYQLDRVFHEKARLGIVTCLISQPTGLTFSDLKQSCGLSDGNLNRHLEVLREAGGVHIDKQGAGRTAKSVYTLTTQGKRSFARYLSELERVLSDAQHAEQGNKV